MNAKTKAPPAPLPTLRHNTATSTLPDARAKQILKEAVDAVVNSFAKHTQGYGRGKFKICKRCSFSVYLLCNIIIVVQCTGMF